MGTVSHSSNLPPCSSSSFPQKHPKKRIHLFFALDVEPLIFLRLPKTNPLKRFLTTPPLGDPSKGDVCFAPKKGWAPENLSEIEKAPEISLP